jgi:hypothetical protein
MRLKLFIPLFLFVILFLLPSTNALCPEITLGKTEFIPEETFQVEMNGNFMRDIVSNDISIVRQSDNVRLPLDISVVKISDSKFFAFFDLPSLINLDSSEDYLIKVSALCSEGFRVRSQVFTIKKPITRYYKDLENEIGNLWPYIPVLEHAAALATFSHDITIYEQARIEFNSKNCPENCNIIENSLAAIGTKNQVYVNWLRNNINGGGEGECWGNPCDVKSTAYALLSLRLLNEEINSSSIIWLQDNAIEDEEKAILVYLTREDEDYFSLISRQSINGYWFKGNIPDFTTTALASFALKSIIGEVNGSSKIIIQDSINKAEEWLLNNFEDADKKEKSFMLYYVFPKENIEAIMAIWPGVVKVESPDSFSLILQNKGETKIDSMINVMNTNLTTSINKEGIKNIQFFVPLMTTPDARVLFQQIQIYYENDYGYTNKYNIPLVIFTQQGEENIGNIGTNETNISTQESQEIKEELNQTNKTTEQESTLIELPLRFDEAEIIRELNLGQSITVTLKLKNELDQELKNIQIQKSSTLINVVEVSPSFIIKMDPNEIKNIVITISPTKEGTFSGTIDASVKIEGTRYSNSVSFQINVLSTSTNITNTCEQRGGKECEEDEYCVVATQIASDTNRCCIPANNCKKQETEQGIPILGIIIFGVVIIALITVLIILTKKKKKQMSEILEEAKQKYETRFQRGLPR